VEDNKEVFFETEPIFSFPEFRARRKAVISGLTKQANRAGRKRRRRLKQTIEKIRVCFDHEGEHLNADPKRMGCIGIKFRGGTATHMTYRPVGPRSPAETVRIALAPRNPSSSDRETALRENPGNMGGLLKSKIARSQKKKKE